MLFSAYRNLVKTDRDHTENIVLGFFNIAQWLIATAFPVLLVINTSHTIHVTVTKSGYYTYMYVCMCVCVYVCMYICMYVCIMYVRMYVCTVHVYTCVYVCMYVCTCIYVCIYMYVYMYVCMYVCMCVCNTMYVTKKSFLR